MKFILRYEIASTLLVKHLWPDGDAPENPTAADVEELIDSCGGWPRIINDWNLDGDAIATVEKIE